MQRQTTPNRQQHFSGGLTCSGTQRSRGQAASLAAGPLPGGDCRTAQGLLVPRQPAGVAGVQERHLLGCRQAGSGSVSWVTEISRPARQPGGSWPAAAPERPGPVVRPAGQQSPVTERKPCQSTPSPAVSAPTARPPITWVGPPACGSLSPPAAGRRRAPEPRPLAGPVSDPAGQAGTAARRSAAGPGAGYRAVHRPG